MTIKRRSFLAATAISTAGVITYPEAGFVLSNLFKNNLNHRVKKIQQIQELSKLGFSLTGHIEQGTGFRIGDKTLDFLLNKSGGEMQIYEDKKTGLEVHRRIEVINDTAIISGHIINNSPKTVQNINIFEPLYLVFRDLPGQWKHIYALGGSSEAVYPPKAYQTNEIRGKDILIESHPGGRSSNLHLPFLISLSPESESGEGLFCAMEWSGTWYMTLRQLDKARNVLSAGVKIKDMELKTGESLSIPVIHLGFFRGGEEGGTNALRRYLYENVCPYYNGAPVLPKVSYDHWFGIANNLSFDLLKKQASRASELGTEVFVVDAGWFRDGFPNGVGNWNLVDNEKFPDGLEPLAEYVSSLGMDFGLWFEIERANPGTQAISEHPDWFVLPEESKNNRAHLNLAIKDAQDWAIETIGYWIKRLNLKWSRWDYNIDPMPFWNAVDPSGKIQFEYFKGLYRVLDTLMSEYPEWMIESCASGGRRIDTGTMKRAHTYWFSDHSENPAITRYMQARANRFMPGHLLNSSIMVKMGQGDEGFNDAAILSRMLGKMAFDGDIASWSPTLTSRAAEWVGVFKSIRYLLVQDFYQLLPMPVTKNDWDAVQFISYSGKNSIVFVFSGSISGEKTLKLRGLRQNRKYNAVCKPYKTTISCTGEDLMNKGLTVKMAGNSAELWIIDMI